MKNFASVRSATMLALILLSGVFSRDGLGQVKGEDVLMYVASTFEGINDYTVTLNVRVDMERLKIPASKVMMYFKKPEKVHFESESFAMLPREGLAFNPAKLLKEYDVENLEEVTDNGIPMYSITLRSRKKGGGRPRVVVTVNRERWTIERMLTTLGRNRNVSLDFEQARIDGFWLPAKLTATFVSDTTDMPDADPLQEEMVAGRARSMRSGSVTVRYTDYRINTGLSDDLFTRKSGKQGGITK